jgi:drug/metabolite transporter (DMT)-like permease
MLGAFLTTIFFSLSAILAARSIRLVGTTIANLGRLLVAFICLGTYAHLAGSGMEGAGRNWFLLSGVIGMGLGDLALFAALPRLGSRLSVLMTQCLAVPIAMAVEWTWLGTRLAAPEIVWSAVILSGVAIALMPSKNDPPKVPLRVSGLVFGFLSAAGQGLGAVVSRRAYEVAHLAGESIDGISAAYQRIAGGLVIAVIYFSLLHLWRHHRRTRGAAEANPPLGTFRKIARGGAIVVLNALAGPVFGVSCYQWALASTPSGIVLPIVATTPLVIVPLSFWIEGDRPTRRSLVGGVVAVFGVVALAIAR